ncbi:MAG: diguanylate cyclase [Bacilli bacterium]|nr:diguanylate cyclase [Bacilli bacterium]
MEPAFVIQNFALICIIAVMSILLAQNIRSRKFMTIILYVVYALVAILAVLLMVEQYTKRDGNLIGATWATFLGFAIRPVCLYSFILLSRKKFGLTERILAIPLVLNVLVYASSVFLSVEWLSHLAFYYTVPSDGGELVYVRGVLNFFAHILGLIYLAYLVVLSMRSLGGKHRHDSISILICAVFIVAAVVIEMFGLAMGVLNLAIAISIVFYYLFLLKEDNRRDALTGLFDRKTFYTDLDRFSREVRGIMEIDMNGLKFINDNQGHIAGDLALKCISAAIEKACPSDMYIYRFGGDEFIILITKQKVDLPSMDAHIKAEVEQHGYSVSIGYASYLGKDESVEELIQRADAAMYEDKAAFYKNNPKANRRSERR